MTYIFYTVNTIAADDLTVHGKDPVAGEYSCLNTS